jgi:hypothetical protein
LLARDLLAPAAIGTCCAAPGSAAAHNYPSAASPPARIRRSPGVLVAEEEPLLALVVEEALA